MILMLQIIYINILQIVYILHYIYNVIFFINSFFAYSGILSFDFKILTVEMEQTNNI